jgi:hypothetical protein
MDFVTPKKFLTKRYFGQREEESESDEDEGGDLVHSAMGEEGVEVVL